MILLTFFRVLCLINCFWLGDGVYVEYDGKVVAIQTCTTPEQVPQKLFFSDRLENITTEIFDAYQNQRGWRMWRKIPNIKFRKFAIFVANTNQFHYLTVVNGRFSLKLSTEPETNNNENDNTVFRITRSRKDDELKLKHKLSGLYIGKNFTFTNIEENACVKFAIKPRVS